MRKFATLAISVILSTFFAGCAAPSMRYAQQNKSRAEQGEIKWSDYYKGLYDVAARANESGQMLTRINAMIDAAQSYEMGNISKDQFEYLRRQAQAGQAVEDEAVSQQRQAAFAAMAKSFNANTVRPQLPAQLAPVQIAPIAPVQAGTAPTFTPATATAYFTGQQRQVQTVTYQSGWSCEYRYINQTFWRTFVGTCPSSVQVQ
jgi:hypothetical protein